MTMLPPVSRITDPRTSRDGEKEVTDSGRRATIMEVVLDAVWEWPGLTSGEIAEKTNLQHAQVWRRLSDLKNRGSIFQGEARTWKGHAQSTWWPIIGTNVVPEGVTGEAVDAYVAQAVAADPELDCGWCLWLKEQGPAGAVQLADHRLKAHGKGEA